MTLTTYELADVCSVLIIPLAKVAESEIGWSPTTSKGPPVPNVYYKQSPQRSCLSSSYDIGLDLHWPFRKRKGVAAFTKGIMIQEMPAAAAKKNEGVLWNLPQVTPVPWNGKDRLSISVLQCERHITVGLSGSK